MGRVINITGKSEPEHTNGAFCAKAGIHSRAKGLSRMVGKHGITVNCVPPGRIHTEQIQRNYTPEYRQWQCENEIPVGRYGEPKDMANLVTFLASPPAGYITGAAIPVDGGLRKYQFWCVESAARFARTRVAPDNRAKDRPCHPREMISFTTPISPLPFRHKRQIKRQAPT